jgi:hypothetical protein
MPATSRDTPIVSKIGPRIVVGLPKLRVLRQNPSIRLAPPKANNARDKVTQRVVISWHYLGPHRGDLTSSSFVSEFRPGGFHNPPPPPSGLAPSHPSSPDRDYPRTMHEIIRSRFVSGDICPCLILWRGTFAHAGSHPPTVTQAPPSLTRHHSAQYQTVIQLTSAGTMPTRQVRSQFSPSGLSKYLRTGSVCMSHTF